MNESDKDISQINVRARINSRKVLIIYIYGLLVYSKGIEKGFVDEIDHFVLEKEQRDIGKLPIWMKQDEIIPTTAVDFAGIEKFFAKRHKNTPKEDVAQRISYLQSEFFSYKKESDISLDYPFIFTIVDYMMMHVGDVYKAINSYTQTFVMERMDFIDQAIFILGYSEHATIRTPKNVLINESVELAKRYGSGGSTKLIHGIMHHICNQ